MTRKETAASANARGEAAREAELSVIGCLLIEPETLAGQIFHRLEPESFGDASLRTVFRAAKELWLEQATLDPVTVLQRCGDGYGALLARAMELTPSCAHWEAYCDAVADNAQLRALQACGVRLIGAATAAEGREALQEAQRLLIPTGRKNRYSWAEMLTGFMDRLEAEPPQYLDWGIAELNEKIRIRRGKFVILAAESSVGKTALALQFAFAMAKQDQKVGFFSLETPQYDAADRMLAQQADINLSDIKRGRVSEAAVRRAGDLAQETYNVPFELIEASGYSVEDIRAETLAQGYEVIFLDYVQMLAMGADNPVEQVRAVSMALHTLSQTLGVTVVALSQVTPPQKNQRGQRPELSKENLRESRQLIHDADAILIMDLSDVDDYRSPRIFKVDKNKDGPRSRMVLSFDAPRLRFTYQPPLRDDRQRAADERNAKMDENRRRRQEREAQKAEADAPIDGQGTLEELPDTGEPLPF